MEYEIIVINKEIQGRSAIRGQIVAVYPKGHPWKKRERESRFAIIDYTGNQTELTELFNGEYRYDFDVRRFIRKKTGEDFDNALVFNKTDAVAHEKVIREVAFDIDPLWEKKEPNVCKFLHPKFLEFPKDGNFNPTRRYWFNKFRKFKHLLGVKDFLATILYRDYGNIAECWKNLRAEVKEEMGSDSIFTEEDKKWNVWKRGI